MSATNVTRHWRNGGPIEAWSCEDRALRYGDGVFESMAVFDGQVQCFERHVARLERGCRALGFAPPGADALSADLAAIEPSLGDAPCQSLRLTVSRGGGGQGYAPPSDPEPARLWALSPWPEANVRWKDAGLRVTWLSAVLAVQPSLAGIKHLNRLEQVLAAQELSATGADEGLVCDPDGYVIEAVSANVFVRDGRTLRTPDVSRCGVGGVARERVLASAEALGYRAEVTRLRRADVLTADEVFLTNALRGARPVAALGGVRWRRFDAARALHKVLVGQVLLP